MTTTAGALTDAGWTDRITASDRVAKRERMLDLLDRLGVDSIVLRSHAAVSWYLDGARTHVSVAADPVMAVVVRRDGDELRIFENEADRVLGEELDRTLRAEGGADLAVTRVP